jgi:hypothetical protein
MKLNLSTLRLLREVWDGDFDALYAILSDRRVMYAYDRVFSPEETRE